MYFPENDEEPHVGAGAHGHLFNNGGGCSTTPDPAPVPQNPSPAPQDYMTYTQLPQEYTLYPSAYYHVRPLAVNSHMYSALPLYSHLPMREASRVTLNTFTQSSLPRMLRQGFLM